MLVKIMSKNDTKTEVLDQVAKYTLNTDIQQSDDLVSIDLVIRDGTVLTVSGDVIYVVSEETRKTIDVLRSKNNMLSRERIKAATKKDKSDNSSESE